MAECNGCVPALRGRRRRSPVPEVVRDWSRLIPVSERCQDSRVRTLAFGLVVLIFVYAASANIIEQSDRIRIALFFVCEIVVTSLVS